MIPNVREPRISQRLPFPEFPDILMTTKVGMYMTRNVGINMTANIGPIFRMCGRDFPDVAFFLDIMIFSGFLDTLVSSRYHDFCMSSNVRPMTPNVQNVYDVRDVQDVQDVCLLFAACYSLFAMCKFIWHFLFCCGS